MKRLIMATMVTAILASSTVWAADNAPVAAQQQTQQVQQTQKTAAAERISEQGLYAMRDVQVARLAGVGVMENQYLMPLKQTRNALADAQKLLDKKQYYEANLALKGAEDGIIVDSEALFVN